jgi:hypothetical protein
MADTVRTPTIYRGDKNGTGITNVDLVVWSGLDGDDTGTPVKMAEYNDKCVQIYAVTTFGSGTVTLEGSNELVPTTWHTLNDILGASISKTAAAMAQVAENPLWIRPKTASGTGADIVVALLCKR